MASQYFAGPFGHRAATAAITDVTPPTFSGIAGLVANANGSLTASWVAATDPAVPLSYEVYMQPVTAVGLFSTGNIVTISRGTSASLYMDALGAPLSAGTTYYVGVRALDAVGNRNTNTVSMSAASVGIADNSLYNLINSRLTATRANNLDNLDTLVSSRASQTSVDQIQNNTSFVGQVPPTLVLPDSGNKVYKFYARLFNDVGQPSDPDGNVMNLRIETTAGGVIVSTTAMTRTGLGLYEYTYSVSATDPERALVVFFEYSKQGIPFQQARTTEVQEFESKLDILLTRLSAPRASNLDNLDATITSRATHADMQTVVSNTNPAAVQANIWDAQTADHAIAGTLGKAVTDAAYAGVSLTPLDLQNIADYIWNEPRSAHTIPNTFGEGAQGQLSPARAANLDKLDVILSSRASTSDVSILSSFTGGRIANLDFLDTAVSSRAVQGTLDAVKAKTDLIPNDVATLAAVSGIPTNPVLVTDPRLNRLDANISTRAVAADLAPLATSTAVSSGFSAVGVGLGNILSALGPKATSTEVAAAVVGLATSGQVAAVGSAVAAVAAAQITVGQIWSYATRSLTEAVQTDISLAGIALKSDVDAAAAEVIEAQSRWKPKFTAAINPLNDTMELVAWLTKDENTVLDADEASVIIRDGDSQVILEVGPDLMIGSDGVFKFTRANASVVLLRNKTYTCEVKVTRASIEYSGLVPITVF